MPRGSKSKYSAKQKRKAGHIEESYEKRGASKKEAERRAWATVNKQDGGAKRSSAGRHGRTTASKSKKSSSAGRSGTRSRSKSRA